MNFLLTLLLEGMIVFVYHLFAYFTCKITFLVVEH